MRPVYRFDHSKELFNWDNDAQVSLTIEDKYKEKELNVNLALLFSLARDVVTVLEVRGPTSEGSGSANPMMRCSMARLRPE
jgi:hypothetical protein